MTRSPSWNAGGWEADARAHRRLLLSARCYAALGYCEDNIARSSRTSTNARRRRKSTACGVAK